MADSEQGGERKPAAGTASPAARPAVPAEGQARRPRELEEPVPEHGRPDFLPSAADVLKIVGDGVISTDGRGEILVFNRAAETIFGYAASEALGQPVDILIPRRFWPSHAGALAGFAGSPTTETRLMGRQRVVTGRRKDGEEFPLEATLSHALVGGAAILTAVVRDITARQRREALLAERSRELEEAERRLRLSLEVGQMGSWQWHVASDRFEADAIARRLWGLPESGILTLADLRRDDLAALKALLSQTVRGEGEFSREMQTLRRDGITRWALIKGAVFLDDDGRARTVTGVIFDTTERRDAEEQRRLVMSELDHRMKNMLTLVNSIISMGGKPGGTVDDFKRSLRERIGAIAHTHRLLLESRWTSATLGELVQAELEAYGYPEGGRIRACGPVIALGAGDAIALGLVLHELATNAVKYGALGPSGGQVELHWHTVSADAGRRMILDWTESGGPPVATPTRRGFGSTLIERMLVLRGAIVAIDYDRAGLRCHIDLPIGPEEGAPAQP